MPAPIKVLAYINYYMHL